MSKKRKLTDEELKFVTENRMNYSVNTLANKLKMSYNALRLLMEEERIGLSSDEKIEKSTERYKNSNKWVSDPWNQRKNLVTMSYIGTFK